MELLSIIVCHTCFWSHVSTNRNIHILSTEIILTKTSQHLCKMNLDSSSIQQIMKRKTDENKRKKEERTGTD